MVSAIVAVPLAVVVPVAVVVGTFTTILPAIPNNRSNCTNEQINDLSCA